MLQAKESEFILSIADVKQKPATGLPEFAFAGRSNVGKSSLINNLVNRKNIARVSKQPGKTRTINYFLINRKFYLVDLPGYGFARVSAVEKERWRHMIENYLVSNPELICLYVLIDGYVGPQKNDLQLIEWLQHESIRFKIIATKCDKIKKTKLNSRLIELQKSVPINADEEIIPYSVKSKRGRESVLAHMELQLDFLRANQ